MPCSECNGVGHNVRTCPLTMDRRRQAAVFLPTSSAPSSQQSAWRRADLSRQTAFLHQATPIIPDPQTRVQHESVSRIVPSGPLVMRHQLQRQLPIPERPYQIAQEARLRREQLNNDINRSLQNEAERLRLQQERRELERAHSINNADDHIDHSLNQIISWGRRLTREIETRRELNVVEIPQHIKLKMIDNMDDHFNAENCPVCLDSYNSSKKNCVTMECRHIVCSGCMIEIVKRKKYECPCCRAPFQELRVLPGVNPETFNLLSDIA